MSSDYNCSAAAQRQHRRRLWKKYLWRRLGVIAVALSVLGLSVWGIVSGIGALAPMTHTPAPDVTPPDTTVTVPAEPALITVRPPLADNRTITLTTEVDAPCAILVDVTEGRIVAQKNPEKQGYPASITKMMTLLVAVENTEDFDSTYEMTFDIVNDTYQQGASRAGFGVGEKVTVTDLLYGCILPSGADATIGLANHLCGSEPAFVELMNERCKTLGLKNTHFQNTSGLHGDKHYSTVTDMAMILMAAMQDETCKEVLSAVKYTTAKTPENPDGLELYSTMFSRMYGDEPTGATVIAGKTGYTTEAGHTMASYAEGEDGHDYVVVTMGGSNRWKATYDCINLLTRYVGGTTEGLYE